MVGFRLELVWCAADSFAPGQGHEPAGEWVGGAHDGEGPECLAERARNAPPSGSNHKRIMVSPRYTSCATAPPPALLPSPPRGSPPTSCLVSLTLMHVSHSLWQMSFSPDCTSSSHTLCPAFPGHEAHQHDTRQQLSLTARKSRTEGVASL